MLHFDSNEEYNVFIQHFEGSRPRKYKIADVQDNSDGSVNVKIKRQYSNASFDEYL